MKNLSVFLIWVATTAFAAEAPKNFHEINTGLFRGARPGETGLNYLADKGFKTIMNIDNDDEAIAFEQKRAAELGMDMISKPLSAFKPPHHSTVDEILEIISDSKRYPLFLHCKHGEDRTGMIAGLYRVEYQNWSPQDAYEEMKNLGFHKVLVALTHYFKRRTGYDDLRSKPWLSFSPFELNMNIE